MRVNILFRKLNSLMLIGFLTVLYGCNPTVVELIEVNDSSVITIKAQNKQLSNVLEQLNSETGIDIFIPEFKDTMVNVDIKQKPVAEALDLLIGADVHYFITTSKDFLSFLPETADKKGRKAETNPQIMKQEPGNYDSTEAIIIKANMKPSSKISELIVSDGTRNTKRPPEKTADTNTKPVKTRISKKDSSQTSYIMLQFIMEDGKIRLLDAVRVPGNYIELPIVVEDFIYTVKKASDVLIVGSIADPTVLHSFPKDAKEPHKVLKVKSGYFNISIPPAYSKSNILKELSFDFYIPEGHIDANTLSISLFDRAKSKLKFMQELKLNNYPKLINL